LVKERERFLAHLEATGTGRSAIRIAAAYLLQVVNILRLRRLRDVTLIWSGIFASEATGAAAEFAKQPIGHPAP